MIAIILIALMIVAIVGFELIMGSRPRTRQDTPDREREGSGLS
ncbi:hypothetical protein [Planobispora longispora]|uniref:Uncharacterized protein n=1 Tax=Planobispora longispora TaxID=28887 RepID=A0A8J3RMB0_9ACTN|nr:hypothetical protein [Planobispora longispora]BFE83635.1 hypothetical protein GCM10020093_062360 [Planobispora longispora]GIH77260.1 hypothetical protein Plo01_36890 [Planobispora longispora]